MGEAVRLHAENHDVGRAHLRQITGDRRVDLEVSLGAGDAEPALLHRPQMRAPGEQHNIRADARQARADVAADRPGAGDDDSHDACAENACATTRR